MFAAQLYMTRRILAMPGLPLRFLYCFYFTRAYVCIDIIRRIISRLDSKLQVNFCMGITDVDDKILKRAAERRVSFVSVARKYEVDFVQSLRKFNVLKGAFGRLLG